MTATTAIPSQAPFPNPPPDQHQPAVQLVQGLATRIRELEHQLHEAQQNKIDTVQQITQKLFAAQQEIQRLTQSNATLQQAHANDQQQIVFKDNRIQVLTQENTALSAQVSLLAGRVDNLATQVNQLQEQAHGPSIATQLFELAQPAFSYAARYLRGHPLIDGLTQPFIDHFQTYKNTTNNR